MRIIKNAKEEKKLHAMRCLEAGTMTVSSAAKRLEISERQVKRLKRSYIEKGEGFILHGNCGRQPKKTLDIKKKQEILEIRNAPEYNTVNTLHFQEILVEKGIIVSYSFLHNLFKENKIRSCKEHRKSKKSPHQRRLRREREGELLQADGTSHQFFKDDKEYYCIHGFIDDATSKITGLYMCKNECMEGYFQVTRQTIENFGVPEALYADGSSIFFSNSNFAHKKTALNPDITGLYVV